MASQAISTSSVANEHAFHKDSPSPELPLEVQRHGGDTCRICLYAHWFVVYRFDKVFVVKDDILFAFRHVCQTPKNKLSWFKRWGPRGCGGSRLGSNASSEL